MINLFKEPTETKRTWALVCHCSYDEQTQKAKYLNLGKKPRRRRQ